jgi:hypothetical protein
MRTERIDPPMSDETRIWFEMMPIAFYGLDLWR